LSETEPNDATPFLPESRGLAALREAAAGCRGCHLWRDAPQTVFGEGRGRSCKPWLEAELDVVRPHALVLLGAIAGKALLGSSFRVTKMRGQAIESDLAPLVTATIHPSAILRAPDDETRAQERAAFARDLRIVAEALERDKA
jgi:uracil-DNA glycosylase